MPRSLEELTPKGTAEERSRMAKESEAHVQEGIKTGKNTSTSVFKESVGSRTPNRGGGMRSGGAPGTPSTP